MCTNDCLNISEIKNEVVNCYIIYPTCTCI